VQKFSVYTLCMTAVKRMGRPAYFRFSAGTKEICEPGLDSQLNYDNSRQRSTRDESLAIENSSSGWRM